MSDPSQRLHLARNAPQILDRFGVDRVMAMWQEAIDLAIDRKRRSGQQ